MYTFPRRSLALIQTKIESLLMLRKSIKMVLKAVAEKAKSRYVYSSVNVLFDIDPRMHAQNQPPNGLTSTSKVDLPPLSMNFPSVGEPKAKMRDDIHSNDAKTREVCRSFLFIIVFKV